MGMLEGRQQDVSQRWQGSRTTKDLLLAKENSVAPGMLFYREIERGYSPDEYGAILLSIYPKLLFADGFLPALSAAHLSNPISRNLSLNHTFPAQGGPAV